MLHHHFCTVYIKCNLDIMNSKVKKKNYFINGFHHVILYWKLFFANLCIFRFLGRGSMFVLSCQQFETMVSLSQVKEAENLIDLGNKTTIAQSLFPCQSF